MRSCVHACAPLAILLHAALLGGAEPPLPPPLENVVLDDGRHLFGTYDEDHQVVVLAAPGHARVEIAREHVLSHLAVVRRTTPRDTVAVLQPGSAPPPADVTPAVESVRRSARLESVDDQLTHGGRRLDEARGDVARQERYLTGLGQRWTWLSQRLAVADLPNLGFETDLTFSLRTITSELGVQRGVLALRQRRVAELEQRLAALRAERATLAAAVARPDPPPPAALPSADAQPNAPLLDELRGEVQRLRREHEQLRDEVARLRTALDEVRGALDQERGGPPVLPSAGASRPGAVAASGVR